MSGSPVRNPSPPRLDREEEVVKGDLIPGTAYSQHWLFSSLLKLLRKVEGLNQEGVGEKPEKAEAEKAHSSPAEKRSKNEAHDSDLTPDAEKPAPRPLIPPAPPQGVEATSSSAPDPSPLTDQQLDALLPPGYEVLQPPLPLTVAGEKIDDETETELCQVRTTLACWRRAHFVGPFREPISWAHFVGPLGT